MVNSNRRRVTDTYGDRVDRRARRKQLARLQNRRPAWFGLGMFGLVGWSIVVPTLLGITLGMWLDDRWPGQVSWTLTLLFIGVILGCFNAWYWVIQEQEDDQESDEDRTNE